MKFSEWAWGEFESRFRPVLRLIVREEIRRADLATREQMESVMSAISDAVDQVNAALAAAKDRIAADVATLLARIDSLVASEALAAQEGQELSDAVSALGGVVADINTIDPIPEPPVEPPVEPPA